ncbi:MAG TPA: hydroxyacid dehydrogenase [Opitutaceae bacterium]|nr:hydroxyacid dehydrogenase [Opitutaceae bacterium]
MRRDADQSSPLLPPVRELDRLVLIALTAADRRRFFEHEVDFEAAGWRAVEPAGDQWEKTLFALNPEILVTAWGTPPLPRSWLEGSDCRLRFVSHVTGSVRRQVPRLFLERGGRVTNWGSAATASVAEQAVLLVLGALREASCWRQKIAMGGEFGDLRTKPLAGRRVGIHGFGRIAVRVAQLLRPFGVEVQAFSAGVPNELFQREGVNRSADLESLFGWSEVLIECEALTPSTTGCVTAALLARLPDDAVFVNVGRGRVVDEAALVQEGMSGRLRIAVDVMSVEPVTANSPLCQIPDALISPHIGGPTMAEFSQLGPAALENVRRYRAGLPLDAEVTLELYDRST